MQLLAIYVRIDFGGKSPFKLFTNSSTLRWGDFAVRQNWLYIIVRIHIMQSAEHGS